MKFVKSLSILCGSVVLLVACSSTPVAPVAPKPSAPPIVQAPIVQPSPAKPAPAIESKVQAVVIPPYLDSKNPLSTNRSVYFDYDFFSIKPEFNSMLELHGRYLSANPKVSIRVEGNADERGSAEYNLALGQKRAESVARALKLNGVKDSQMEAVSWGNEKPKAMGHDEAAWAQNRRVDLGYPGK
jgi:peptidoglycan-associated lipoprotein